MRQKNPAIYTAFKNKETTHLKPFSFVQKSLFLCTKVVGHIVDKQENRTKKKKERVAFEKDSATTQSVNRRTKTNF